MLKHAKLKIKFNFKMIKWETLYFAEDSMKNKNMPPVFFAGMFFSILGFTLNSIFRSRDLHYNWITTIIFLIAIILMITGIVKTTKKR